MKIIELLSDHIDEELDDACTYAKLALEYKESDPELAQLFYKLSTEEMNHMDMLHKRAVVFIEKYKQMNGEAPAGMKAIYDFVHMKQIEKAEKVTNLQNMFRK